MRIVVLLCVIQLCILGTACDLTPTGKALRNTIHINSYGQAEVILDNWINTSQIQVYVYPQSPPVEPTKVLFVPFRVTQQMENFLTVGNNISRIIWQNWLQNNIFSTLEFLQNGTAFRPDVSLTIAKQKGANLVVGGYITDFIDGGLSGDTRVSIAIEIYDVSTGNLIWSLAQAGSMQATSVNDFIIFATKTRMPTNPSTAVINLLAEDMGKKIKEWTNPSFQEEPWLMPEPSAF